MLSLIHLNSYMIDPKTNNRYIHKYFTERKFENYPENYIPPKNLQTFQMTHC